MVEQLAGRLVLPPLQIAVCGLHGRHLLVCMPGAGTMQSGLSCVCPTVEHPQLLILSSPQALLASV